jgi:hypothetical protein
LVREVAASAEFPEAEARALAELVLAEVPGAKRAACGKVLVVVLAAEAGWEPAVARVAEQEAVRAAVQDSEAAVVLVLEAALALEGVVAPAEEVVLAALVVVGPAREAVSAVAQVEAAPAPVMAG